MVAVLKCGSYSCGERWLLDWKHTNACIGEGTEGGEERGRGGREERKEGRGGGRGERGGYEAVLARPPRCSDGAIGHGIITRRCLYPLTHYNKQINLANRLLG